MIICTCIYILITNNRCGANNFSRRDECFKCHAQKPGGSGGGSGSSSSRRGTSSGGGGGDRSYRDRERVDRDRGDRRERYDDRSRGGGRDDYRKDNSRYERRDRPY